MRWAALRSVALVAAYVLAVNLFFSPVQRRIWNEFTPVDLLIMVVLIGPFLATRWIAAPRTRAARWAWYLCAVMAIDVLAFGAGTFIPTRGHPSLEALVSMALAFVKAVLIWPVLALFVIASFKGERVTTLVLGAVCLIGETLYTVSMPNDPVRWILFFHGAGS